MNSYNFLMMALDPFKQDAHFHKEASGANSTPKSVAFFDDIFMKKFIDRNIVTFKIEA